MKSYWIRIALRALVVFVVVYGGYWGIHSGIKRFENIRDTNVDINIPIRFLSFRLDGDKVGDLRNLTISRSSPKRITGFHITATITDPAALAKISEDCEMTVDNPARLGPESSFKCLSGDNELIRFGQVTILNGKKGENGGPAEDLDLPLVLPSDIVAEFRGNRRSNVQGANADSIANAIRGLGDSIAGTVGAALRQAGNALPANLDPAAADSVRSALHKAAADLGKKFRDEAKQQRQKAGAVPEKP